MFRRSYLLTLSALALILFPPGVFSEEAPADLRARIDAAVAKVKPALVRIHVVAADYHQGREVRHEGVGSGVIISKDGYVLSNHHVAGHGKRLVCTLSDNRELEAELVGTDALADLSVLKLKPEESMEFPAAEFGDSDAIAVGDPVLAMGSPHALSQSVTLGIISNTKLVMPTLFWPFDRMMMDGEDVGSIVRWIGHDAAIYGGNSGGPLVDLDGRVIGINEISFGLSGAIPGNLAQHVASDIIEHGKVMRSWLGLEVQPLLKHDDEGGGVLVSGAVEGSPADEAGFMSGDIIRYVGEEKVNVHHREDLPLFNSLIAGLPINETVEFVVFRDGAERIVAASTIEREEMQPRQSELKQWGIAARNLSYVVAKEMKLKTQDGVLVTSVRPGGPAGEARPSISAHDVIGDVNGTPISNLEDLKHITAEVTKGQDEPVPVLVTFTRKTEQFVTVVKVGIRELDDPGLEAKKAWLPVSMQVITRELAVQIGRPDLMGMRITQVFPDSVAEEAGLRVGDLIVKLDGEPIEAAYSEDYEILPTMIRQRRVGSEPYFTVLRGDEEMIMPIKLGRAPKVEREMKKYRDDHFDFTVRDVAFHDRVEEEWEEAQEGVLVSEVVQGGWAAVGHVAVDDLLMEVNGVAVPDTDTLDELMEKMAEDEPVAVVFRVLRGIHTLYLELEPDWKELE